MAAILSGNVNGCGVSTLIPMPAVSGEYTDEIFVLHPLSTCLGVLSNAIWKDDKDELEKAINLVSRYYRYKLVSPMEIAYLLGYTLITTDGILNGQGLNTVRGSIEPYVSCIMRIAQVAFAGVPLDREWSSFFFTVGGPLKWLDTATDTIGFKRNLIAYFLFEIVKTNGLTLDFVGEVLSHSVYPDGFLKRHITSAGGMLGSLIVFNDVPGSKTLKDLALENPKRYVEVVDNYLSRMAKSLLTTGKINEDPTVFSYQANALNVIERLLQVLIEVVDRCDLDAVHRDKVGRIAMLAPYLTYHKKSYLTFSSHQEVLTRALAKGWIPQETWENFMAVYHRGLRSILSTFLSEVFVGRPNHLKESKKATANLMLSMISLDSLGTRDIVVSALRQILVRDSGQRYTGVGTDTIKRRFASLLLLMIEESSSILPELTSKWMGHDDILDKLIQDAYGKAVRNLA